MTLHQIIKALQAAPKKGGFKLAILEQHKDNELLQAYLKAVYDPRITYGIKNLPKVGGISTPSFPLEGDDIWEIVKNLSENKVRGKTAEWFLKQTLGFLNEEGRELYNYIIKRDIKADIAEGTILKVWPDLFYIPAYQRCSKMDDKAKKRFAALEYFFVQTKSDGQFSYLLNLFNKAPESMSRAGSIYPSWLPEKLSEGLPKGLVLAGEMLVYKNGVMLDRKTGNGILNSVLSGEGSKFDASTMRVEYVAWDMLTEDEFMRGNSARSYEQRLEMLKLTLEKLNLPHVKLAKTWKVKSIAEAVKIQNEHLARKEEGTVWKSPEMLWRDCESGDPLQVKAKLVFDADFKIVGMYEGEGKNVGKLGGFNLESSEGAIKFNVGSGFSDKQREEFWNLGHDYFNGKIVTVEGNSIETAEGKATESLFLPIFVEVREDKRVADTREEVWAAFNAARGCKNSC